MLNLKPSRKISTELDLVPLINIIFLLLIFFMLTSSSISGLLKTDLPEAESSNKIGKKNIVIKVSAAGPIELNEVSVSSNDLQERVKDELSRTKNQVIEIHGDKKLEFETFGKIISGARKAGAREFIFATQKPLPPPD